VGEREFRTSACGHYKLAIEGLQRTDKSYLGGKKRPHLLFLLSTQPRDSGAWLLSSSRCARLLAAASYDAAAMAVAAFAEARFVGISNSKALRAIFFDRVQFDSALAMDIAKQRLPGTGLAAVCCFTWDATANAGLLLQPSVRPSAVAAAPRLDGLHSILPALATPSASTPLLAAWHISQREKPRVKSAQVEGMAVRTGRVMHDARRVRCAVAEEQRGEGLCG
tara:strand:- start:97 stop:765 length:669 start_codon:yes stop_codon:yes gene_type:complete